MRAALLALGLLAACAAAPRPRARRPRRRVAVAAAPAPGPAPAAAAAAPSTFYTPAPAGAAATGRAPQGPAVDPGRCRTVLAHNESIIARSTAREDCAGAAATVLRESFGRCAESPHGDWVASLVGVREREGASTCELQVEWRALLLHRGGTVVEADDAPHGRVTRSFRVLADGDAAQEYSTLTLLASDLDGDRLPELVVSERAVRYGAEPELSLEVYSARGSAVETFEATRAMTLNGAMDFDDDGRIDLTVPAPYAWSEGAECGMTVMHEPLSMLAHALPGGGFSTTDEVAARYLRQVCPSADAEAAGEHLPRGEREGVSVVCRRLWGASPDDALAPYRCRRFRVAPSARCAGTQQQLEPLDADECPAHYEAWAHVDPPLRLR